MSRQTHNGIVLPKYKDKKRDFNLHFTYNKYEINPARHPLAMKVIMIGENPNQLTPDINSHKRQQTIPVTMPHRNDAMKILLNIFVLLIFVFIASFKVAIDDAYGL